MPILMIIGFIYVVKKRIEFDKEQKEYMACMEELHNRQMVMDILLRGKKMKSTNKRVCE